MLKMSTWTKKRSQWLPWTMNGNIQQISKLYIYTCLATFELANTKARNQKIDFFILNASTTTKLSAETMMKGIYYVVWKN